MRIIPQENYTIAGISINVKDRVINHLRENRLEVISLINENGEELIEAINNVRI